MDAIECGIVKLPRVPVMRKIFPAMLALDSSLDEATGPQGNWLAKKIDKIPADVDFVFIMFHHPPYTSSSDEKKFGGGHSARASEQKLLAKLLEERQAHTRARFIVFSGHVHNYERHEHGGVIYFVPEEAELTLIPSSAPLTILSKQADKLPLPSR